MKTIFKKTLARYHKRKYLNLRKVAIIASLTVCIFANNANAGQSCNITESQIALTKQTFGKHYQTLTNNLSIKHENYKEDGYCIISGMAEHGGGSEEAAVILDDKEVYGAILTEGEIYKTQNLDEDGKIEHWIKGFAEVKAVYTIGNLEPRYGKLEVLYDSGTGKYSVKLNDKIVINKNNDYQSISLEKFYNTGLSDAYLIFKNTGGSACPGMFQIVSVNQNKEITASPEFGTCSDLFSDKIEGDKLEIVITEFGSNDSKVVAVYQDGKVEDREVKIGKDGAEKRVWR